ncbi:MAG: hypothetical protein FWB74_08480 [Defluviitaleaceae bacterium]|nr:hypothetical protein [Defluviitaleaceae bacterium]
MDIKKSQDLTKQHFEGVIDPQKAAKELLDKLEASVSKMKKLGKREAMSFYDLYIEERPHGYGLGQNQPRGERTWGALALGHSYDELIDEGVAASILEIIKRHIYDENINLKLQHSRNEFMSYIQIKASTSW